MESELELELVFDGTLVLSGDGLEFDGLKDMTVAPMQYSSSSGLNTTHDDNSTWDEYNSDTLLKPDTLPLPKVDTLGLLIY